MRGFTSRTNLPRPCAGAFSCATALARAAITPDGEFFLGRISRQAPTIIEQDEWSQQNFTIPSFILSRGQDANTLIIGRVPSVPPTVGAFDDFQVRDIYVFFKQDDD
jgi:hypothetical protein